MDLKCSAIVCSVVSSLLGTGSLNAQPVVPGYQTSVYAQLPTGYLPYTLSFDAVGRLYCASNNNAVSGAQLIRVLPNGTLENFPPSLIYDPDGVCIDPVGLVSGVAGSMLVASADGSSSGRVWRVLMNGTVSTLFGPSTTLNNAGSMVFDAVGHLYLNAIGALSIVRFAPAQSTILTLPAAQQPILLAIDATGKLWISCADGKLRRYNVSGASAVLETTVTIGASAFPSLGRGSGGYFPDAIYASDRTTGKLFRVNADASLTQIGSGFTNLMVSIASDSAGALYIADDTTDRVWRIACGADFNHDGFVTGDDFDAYVAAFEQGDSAADYNGDGFVTGDDFDAFVLAFESGC